MDFYIIDSIDVIIFPIIIVRDLITWPSFVTIRTNVLYAVAVGIIHAAKWTFCCHNFLFLDLRYL